MTSTRTTSFTAPRPRPPGGVDLSSPTPHGQPRSALAFPWSIRTRPRPSRPGRSCHGTAVRTEGRRSGRMPAPGASSPRLRSAAWRVCPPQRAQPHPAPPCGFAAKRPAHARAASAAPRTVRAGRGRVLPQRARPRRPRLAVRAGARCSRPEPPAPRPAPGPSSRPLRTTCSGTPTAA